MRSRLASSIFSALAVGCLGTVAIISACGGDDDDGSKFRDGGPDGNPASSSNGGFKSDVDVDDIDSGPQPACVSQQADAVPGTRPVDIIFAIDNSESMGEEIGEVENQINDNFASIIESSGTDYHVIMLSHHGAHSGPDAGLPPGQSLQEICVRAPLSGTTCSPIPAQPANTAKFLHHNTTISSNDALCKILQTLNTSDLDHNHPQGWATFLRPEAFKVFAVISDDRPNTTCNGLTFNDQDNLTAAPGMASSFDSAMIGLAPTQFGSFTSRKYIWNSIIGVAGFDQIDTSKPYPPTAPINLTQCTPGAESSAPGYQALSILTGGLRFPTCGLNFTTMFQSMARGVIDKATVACDYAVPADPPAGKIDPATAVVRYNAGNGTTQDFGQVPDPTQCAAGKFYIAGGRIKLCPDACDLVQGDQNAKVTVLYSCFPKDIK